MNLPEPECKLGYPVRQAKEILGYHYGQFWAWMQGQTMAICDGTRYNHETGQHEPYCDMHGTAYFPWDVRDFLRGLPPQD